MSLTCDLYGHCASWFRSCSVRACREDGVDGPAAEVFGVGEQNLNNIPASKTSTVTVNTVYTSSGGQRAKGYATGTPAAAPGWAWVGEAGPELVKFRGGETVVPNSVSTGYANGAGMPGDQHIHVYLDGRQIYSSVQKQAVASQRRTGHNGLAKRTR